MRLFGYLAMMWDGALTWGHVAQRRHVPAGRDVKIIAQVVAAVDRDCRMNVGDRRRAKARYRALWKPEAPGAAGVVWTP